MGRGEERVLKNRRWVGMVRGRVKLAVVKDGMIAE